MHRYNVMKLLDFARSRGVLPPGSHRQVTGALHRPVPVVSFAGSSASLHLPSAQHVHKQGPKRASVLQAWGVQENGMCTVPPAPSVPVLSNVHTALTTQSEYYVYACAFMLSSGLDLGKLKSKLTDVLHDYGKDYLVLSFRPSKTTFEPPKSYPPRANGVVGTIHDLPGALSNREAPMNAFKDRVPFMML
jgi:hypothetical protein